MTDQFFSYQINEWIHKRYEELCEQLADNLINNFEDNDDFYTVVEEFALGKLTNEAAVELAHVREMQKKSCGFDECKHYPGVLRGLK